MGEVGLGKSLCIYIKYYTLEEGKHLSSGEKRAREKLEGQVY